MRSQCNHNEKKQNPCSYKLNLSMLRTFISHIVVYSLKVFVKIRQDRFPVVKGIQVVPNKTKPLRN